MVGPSFLGSMSGPWLVRVGAPGSSGHPFVEMEVVTMECPPSSQGPYRGSERAKARRVVTVVTIMARLASIAYYAIRALREWVD